MLKTLPERKKKEDRIKTNYATVWVTIML